MFKLALHWQILIAMIVGATVGLLLNLLAGESRAVSPAGADLQWSIEDSSNRTRIETTLAGVTSVFVVESSYVPGQFTNDQQIDAEGRTVRYFVTHGDLQAQHADVYGLYQQHGRSIARRVGDGAGALGSLFLRLLKMVAIPLIVTSLITGIVGLGSTGRLGRMFGVTLSYYLATSLLAIVTGLALVNLIRPGERGQQINVAAAVDAEHQHRERTLGEVLWEQLETMIPSNPFAALAEGSFLAIISFSLLFAVFTVIAGDPALRTIREIAHAGFEVMMRMTMAIIHLAPVGVLFMMLAVTATQGAGVFSSLGWYMLTVACALGFHALVTLPLILHFVAKRSPTQYAKAMSPALLTAFSSASSNGTLPLTLTCTEQRGGISNRVSSFVLPLGATINMDGTALYEVVAVLFIAQWTPGFDLSFTQQIVVVITALLASVGAAGIPHAGLVMMIIILQAVGLPTEKQALIIAVDRVLDMCRTSVNVWSDSCGCAVVARFEAASRDKVAAQRGAEVAIGSRVEDQS